MMTPEQSRKLLEVLRALSNDIDNVVEDHEFWCPEGRKKIDELAELFGPDDHQGPGDSPPRIVL